MEAFDHVATNDDTNRQVGRLNYFPLCRAVQVAFKTGVSRAREGRAASPSLRMPAPSFFFLFDSAGAIHFGDERL